MNAIIDEFTGSFAAVPPLTSAIRLLAAVLLGAMIGFEREWKGKPAGLRTHILVSAGAALFVLVGQELGQLGFGDAGAKRVDPLRLIEAVTAGVAFIAAGLIFTAQGKVRNITTGAGLWLTGAVGLACGAGEVPLAAMAAALVLIVLTVLGWIERSTNLDTDHD